ncbi:VirB4 family type IV secretion system protein [Listeria monocytogenes]|uniref:VirB4 family type IV secretion system protein n=1 Tax=Listeria monocytogenes TaxID=1639 RepID=UPI0011EAD85F|nr:hypothetical protein [Listeria monocytogenes]TYV33093.1 hypothetical protein FZ060_14730 [Listeria monocytogenes]
MYIDDTQHKKVTTEQKKKNHEKNMDRGRGMQTRIPFMSVTTDGGFRQKREYTDYLEIQGTHIQRLHPSEKLSALANFSFFLRKFRGDLKIIFMPFPADTQSQIDYISHKILKNPNSDWYPFQKDRRDDLQKIRQRKTHQEFYLQFFADSEEELKLKREELIENAYQFFSLTPLSLEKKIKILYKLNNMNSEFMAPRIDEDKDWANQAGPNGIDEEFVSMIQPQGNMAFSERYIRKGDGYETCLEIYGYPRENAPFWGDKLFNRPGVITIIDIKDMTKEKLIRALNNSIEEQERRWSEARNAAAKKTAKAEYDSLNQLLEDLIYGSETAKEMVTRMYLYAPTVAELNKQTRSIQSDMSTKGYHLTTFLSELDHQWEALFVSYKRQNLQLKRRGQEIKTFSLAASYPFNFSQLMDERGLYVGYTRTQGVVLLDLFTKNDIRRSYNFMNIGTMGAGKSEALKKISSHNTIIGNYTYIFSVSNEYKRQAEALGGIHLDLSGKDGSVNPLQVFGTEIVDEKTLEVDEHGSFTAFVSSKKIDFSFYQDGRDPEIESEYEIRLRQFYQHWCDQKGMSMDSITQYENDQYPILSDFLEYMLDIYYVDVEQKVVNPHLSEFEQSRFDRIILTLRSIISNYGTIFNRHTSFPDLEKNHHCVFNMESLLKQNTNIFNAQFFNILSLVLDTAIRRGQKEKHSFDRGEKSYWDIIYSMIVIDEFVNIIKSGNELALKKIDRLFREGRKYFLSSGIATQNFRDVLPEVITSDMDKVMTQLFNLATYKFVMNQDVESVEAISRAFRGQFSQAELERIPELKTGHTILSISGCNNIHFKFDISHRERMISDGGA